MTGEAIASLVLQIAVGLGGLAGLGSLLMVRAQKRKIIADSGKTNAEADSVYADAQAKRTAREISLLDPYERIQVRLQDELDEANEKIDRLTIYVESLVQIIRQAGVPVPPMPPPPRRTRRQMAEDAAVEDDRG